MEFASARPVVLRQSDYHEGNFAFAYSQGKGLEFQANNVSDLFVIPGM